MTNPTNPVPMLGLSYIGATDRAADEAWRAWEAAGRPMQLVLPFPVAS